MGACRRWLPPNRDTTRAIRDAGFNTDTLDRFIFRPMPMLPASAHLLGTAARASTR